MTRRERIADWISGGAITRARENADVWVERYEAKVHALHGIAEATAGVTNGTGRMVNRMAWEAINDA